MLGKFFFETLNIDYGSVRTLSYYASENLNQMSLFSEDVRGRRYGGNRERGSKTAKLKSGKDNLPKKGNLTKKTRMEKRNLEGDNSKKANLQVHKSEQEHLERYRFETMRNLKIDIWRGRIYEEIGSSENEQ